MNVLVVSPPLSAPSKICSSVPLLVGQLLGSGINATALDLNIKFLKDVLSVDYLKSVKQLLLDRLNSDLFDIEYKSYISDILNNNFLELVLNSNEDFYKKLLEKSFNEENEKLFKYIFSFVFSQNVGSSISFFKNEKICFLKEKNSLFRNNYNELIKRCNDSNHNLYIDYYKKLIQSGYFDKYDVVAISIPFETHLYPSLTLAKLLKEMTDIKVVLGGILINATSNTYIKYKNMFGKYFDDLLVGEGENSIVEYCKYINNEISAENVSGLIYKSDDNIIFQNKKAVLSSVDDIFPPNYDDVNFSDYISDVIHIEFSKGCYWGKCSYCYSSSNKRYHVKNYKIAADILQLMYEKYKISNFSISDDSLNINFALKLSEEIISRRLHFSIDAFFRVEKQLDFDVLQKLKQAGFNTIFLGLESASERISKLMNKGIDISVTERIINDCYKLGINCSLGVMFGYPTETEKDVYDTVYFVKKHFDKLYIINSFYFTLLKDSKILDYKKELKISKIVEPEEFSNYLLYTAPCVKREKVNKILDEVGIPALPIYTKW